MIHLDLFVNFDNLEIVENNDNLKASVKNINEVKNIRRSNTKYFQVAFDEETSEIVEIFTTYQILMSGKLRDFEETFAIVDDRFGDVYSLEELILTIFER